MNRLTWAHTGAFIENTGQHDADASLGGLRSSSEVHSLLSRRFQAILDVTINQVSAENGAGVGMLRSTAEGLISWQAPGDDEGTGVTVVAGATALLESDDADMWVRVTRSLSGSYVDTEETVALTEVLGNAIGGPHVEEADSTAGSVKYRGLIVHNTTGETASDLRVWVDADNDTAARVGDEAVSGGAIQEIANEDTAPTAVSFDAGTTESTGLSLGDCANGAGVGIWIERTISALSSAATWQNITINYAYTISATRYYGSLRGFHHTAEDAISGLGIWIGSDAEPDLSASPDYFYQYDTVEDLSAALPFSVNYVLPVDHKYFNVPQWRNRFGLWSPLDTSTSFVVDAAGTEGTTPPIAPEGVIVYPALGDAVAIEAVYLGGSGTADAFGVWLTSNATDPTPTGDPDYYQRMPGESLALTTSATFTTGQDIRVQVVAIIYGPGTGTVQESDDTVLPATGAGTVVTSGSFADWDASGEFAVRRLGSDRVIEVVTYSSRTADTLTVGSAGRAQWGTTASAGTLTDLVTPVAQVHSLPSAVASTIMATVATPERPLATQFLGSVAGYGRKVGPVSLDSPDATVVWIDEPNNIYFLLNPASTSLYIDTALMWRCIYDSGGVGGTIYIPSELDRYTAAVAGTPSGDGVIDVSGTDTVLFSSGTAYVLKADAGAGTITATNYDSANTATANTPETGAVSVTVNSVDGVNEQHLLVWDATLAINHEYWNVDTDGSDPILRTDIGLNRLLTQAEVVAL